MQCGVEYFSAVISGQCSVVPCSAVRNSAVQGSSVRCKEFCVPYQGEFLQLAIATGIYHLSLIHSVQCARVECAVYGVQCTVCSVQCAVCSV